MGLIEVNIPQKYPTASKVLNSIILTFCQG